MAVTLSFDWTGLLRNEVLYRFRWEFAPASLCSFFLLSAPSRAPF